MHQIYQDQGTFNFLYNLPTILYSTVISATINIIITNLSLTEKDITDIRIKVERKKRKINKVISETEKCLKIKITLFFLFNFLFIIFFWYYLASFCAVYTNTQTHIFKDVSLSFVVSLLYPFGLCFLPGIFRIPSLRSRDKNVLYTLSIILQLLLKTNLVYIN